MFKWRLGRDSFSARESRSKGPEAWKSRVSFQSREWIGMPVADSLWKQVVRDGAGKSIPFAIYFG